MKIVVCVKQAAVLEDEPRLTSDGRRVDPDSVDWELNSWDEFALEAALEIRDQHDGTEVVAVTVGGDDADDAVIDCLGRGADRGVRVEDDALVDADVLQVARTLARVVEREEPDLVLCGVQSSDSANGATGVALAGYAGLPHVAVVRGLKFDPGQRSALVDRELEGGLIERMSLRTPAVITVQTGMNTPRYATLRAIKQARQKPLDVLGLADIELDEADLTPGARVVAVAPPARSDGAEMLEGDASSVAERIADIIRRRLGQSGS